ncbi:MAG: bacillithiol biosynthesis BshC [bacterium]
MTDVRILSEPLGGSPLSLSIQRGDAPAAWCIAPPCTITEWKDWAATRLAERDWSKQLAALAPAFAATGLAAEKLQRVIRDGGVVVTTGQQPGLFGGPVYTWSKAIGALAFADALERETGIPTAAVFWAATDDADYAEAAHTTLARTGGAEEIRTETTVPAGTPMSLTPLGDVSRQLALLADATGSASDPRPLAAVQGAYSNASCTVGDAYVALLRDLLAPLGMPVLDASHPAVRAASESTLRAALDQAVSVEAALTQRTRALREGGFDPQVEDVAGLSLVFVREGTVKRRVSIAEAKTLAPDAWLTPNVLLRAVVERQILPTVAYLGGPGELAYFAQVSAVAQALDVAAPVALPRWSCTLIEPHIARLLTAFGIEPDALATPDALEGKVARSAMSEPSRGALESVRRAIQSLPPTLAPESDPLGLNAAMQGAMQSMLHRLDRMERRLVAGIKRREITALRDVATLRAALYPHGIRQERTLNLTTTLARHGLDLLQEMRMAAGAHASALINPTSVHGEKSATAAPAAR